MDLIDVVFPLAVLFFALCAGHLDGGAFDLVLRGIGPVPLDGNGKYEITGIGRVKAFVDVRKQRAVPHPSDLIDIILVIHVFI